ncbi:Spermatogenesis-associated protein 6 [Tupaia chinensis]|uniref:Spermatogenesis-associated protein 6 n=1 Tax=Tupaia chinensis TaxID=246437 RepID=L9L113_TUPCH|nr:Spermatogenesis-associated protein 6 [Tupaia chinensis]
MPKVKALQCALALEIRSVFPEAVDPGDVVAQLELGETLSTYDENTRDFMFPGPNQISGHHDSNRQVTMRRISGLRVDPPSPRADALFGSSGRDCERDGWSRMHNDHAHLGCYRPKDYKDERDTEKEDELELKRGLLYRDSAYDSDPEYSSYQRPRGTLHLDDGEYWSNRAASYKGKSHRPIFENSMDKMYRNLYKKACSSVSHTQESF